jgi:hypothetical protein
MKDNEFVNAEDNKVCCTTGVYSVEVIDKVNCCEGFDRHLGAGNKNLLSNRGNITGEMRPALPLKDFLLVLVNVLSLENDPVMMYTFNQGNR